MGSLRVSAMSTLATKRPRVVLLEDDDALRTAMDAILREQGFEVEALADGETALLRTQAAPPDLLLISMSEPDATRFDFAQAGDALSHFRIPVLVMRGRYDANSDQTSPAALLGGVQGCLDANRYHPARL